MQKSLSKQFVQSKELKILPHNITILLKYNVRQFHVLHFYASYLVRHFHLLHFQRPVCIAGHMRLCPPHHPTTPEFCLVHAFVDTSHALKYRDDIVAVFVNFQGRRCVCVKGRYILPRFSFSQRLRGGHTARNSTELFTTCLKVSHISKWTSNIWR